MPDAGPSDPPGSGPGYWVSDLEIRGLAYGASKYVAVGRERFIHEEHEPNVGVVYTSDDGSSWTLATRVPDWFSDVAFGNGIFVALAPEAITGASPLSSNMTIYTSTDGRTWKVAKTVIADPIARSSANLAFGDGKFVAAVSGGQVLQSADGVAWSPVDLYELTPVTALTHVEYGGGAFVFWDDGSISVYRTEIGPSGSGASWSSFDPTPSSPHSVQQLFGSATGFSGIAGYNCCFGETGGPFYGRIASTDGKQWNFLDGPRVAPVFVEDGLCVNVGTTDVTAGTTCDNDQSVVGNDTAFTPLAVLKQGKTYLVGGGSGILAKVGAADFQRAIWKTSWVSY